MLSVLLSAISEMHPATYHYLNCLQHKMQNMNKVILKDVKSFNLLGLFTVFSILQYIKSLSGNNTKKYLDKLTFR